MGSFLEVAAINARKANQWWYAANPKENASMRICKSFHRQQATGELILLLQNPYQGLQEIPSPF